MMITRAPRVQPLMPQQAYQTFAVLMPRTGDPKTTHWRPATCEEVGCARYLNGWRTPYTAGTPEGDRIVHAIRNSPIRRKYTVLRLPDNKVEVIFEPGQPCFLQDHPATQHQVPVLRPQIHVVRSGDWRTPGSVRRATRRVHTSGQFWVEEFAENQDRLKTLIERG